MGELSERIESWEVLLYEVLDGRPIWDLSQAPTQRGQATREPDSAPMPAHQLARAYSTPAPKSSLQLDAGGSLWTGRHFQIKKDEISAGRTKNAARDWGFFSQFETPRAES